MRQKTCDMICDKRKSNEAAWFIEDMKHPNSKTHEPPHQCSQTEKISVVSKLFNLNAFLSEKKFDERKSLYIVIIQDR